MWRIGAPGGRVCESLGADVIGQLLLARPCKRLGSLEQQRQRAVQFNGTAAGQPLLCGGGVGSRDQTLLQGGSLRLPLAQCALQHLNACA